MADTGRDTADTGPLTRETQIEPSPGARDANSDGFLGEEEQRGREVEAKTQADSAATPSPPSPQAPVVDDETRIRAKTPPTFGEVGFDDALRNTTRRHDAPGGGTVGKAHSKEVFKKEEKVPQKKYPLSYLFPDGKLYRDPPVRYQPSKAPTSNYEIPDDELRFAVDVNAPSELKRSTKIRALAEINKLNNPTRDETNYSYEFDDTHTHDAHAVEKVDTSLFRSDDEDGLGSSDVDETADDAAFSKATFLTLNRNAPRAKKTKLNNLDSATADIMQIAQAGRPRMRLKPGKHRLHPEQGTSGGQENAKTQDLDFKTSSPKTLGTLVGDRIIAMPVKGFRTPRSNESATAAIAALMDVDVESPKLLTPFTVGSVIVVSMGKIDPVLSIRSSSASHYILPIGFVSRRKYASVTDPDQRVWYESKVEAVAGEDGMDGDTPDTTRKQSEGNFRKQNVRVIVFERDVPNPQIFTGQSPTSTWQKVIAAVNEQAQTRKRSSVSGPQFLGLSSPVVAAEIAKMEGYAEARAALEKRKEKKNSETA